MSRHRAALRPIPGALGPDSIAQANKPLGLEWSYELWEVLLDASYTVLEIWEHLCDLQPVAESAPERSLPLPSREAVTAFEQHLDALSANRTSNPKGYEEFYLIRTVEDFLTTDEYLKSMLDPLKDRVVGFPSGDKAIDAQIPINKLMLLDLLFRLRIRQIALFTKKMKEDALFSTHLPISVPGWKALATLREWVSAVDSIMQHVRPVKEHDRSADQSRSEPPYKRPHLGRSINNACWQNFSLLGDFRGPLPAKYISFQARIVGLGVTLVAAGFTRLYLRWSAFLCLVISIGMNAGLECLYYGDLKMDYQTAGDPMAKIRPDLQMYALHALIYVYLNVGLSELCYMAMWFGVLVGVNYGLWYFVHSRTGSASSWSTAVYNVMAGHFVVFAIHLRVRWLTMAWTTLLIGVATRMAILMAIRMPVHWTIICLGSLEFPFLYLLASLASAVPFVAKAGYFTFQLFAPGIIELALAGGRHYLGWEPRPIDISSALLKGIMNVLVIFFGYTWYQAIAFTSVIQVVSFIQGVAPRFGMR